MLAGRRDGACVAYYVEHEEGGCDWEDCSFVEGSETV